MSELKCPFCQQELRKIHPTYVICDNCRITGEDKLWQELIKTKQELEQSETCCTEWEKQALDCKAENIALSGELELTRKALYVARYAIGWINQMTDEHTDKQAIKIKCEYALDQIKQITETKE